MSVIIFHDKSTKVISDKQADALLELSTKQESFSLNGCLYKFSSIAKILSDEEYKKQYPNLTLDFGDNFPQLPEKSLDETIDEMKPGRRLRVLKGVRKGIEEFINQNPDSTKAKLLLDRFNLRIKEAEKENS